MKLAEADFLEWYESHNFWKDCSQELYHVWDVLTDYNVPTDVIDECLTDLINCMRNEYGD